MAKYPGLMRRGSRWYLRAKVPADLVEEVGRREIWHSLDTGSHVGIESKVSWYVISDDLPQRLGYVSEHVEAAKAEVRDEGDRGD
jgi:hypothetical protein